MGSGSTKERKIQTKNQLKDSNKNNLTQKEQSKIKNLQEQQEANLEQIQGQQKGYPSQQNKEFLQPYKMEAQNMQPKNDQEVQEFNAKFKCQNNSQDQQLNIKQQKKSLTFEQTACGIHKDKGQNLAFLNRGSNTSQKLICYICQFEQQIQKENLFMLDQFFAMSEKEYLKNFLQFEQDESSEIYEKIFDKNYGQQYSKMHIDALTDFKNKINKYIDDQIKQINQAMQTFQKTEENLIQKFNNCKKQYSFQQILSQKYSNTNDLQIKISKLLEEQSQNIKNFESNLKEYRTNLFKEFEQQDQIIQSFQKNLKDFISSNDIFNINYPKEFENQKIFYSSQIISYEESQMIKKWISNKFFIFKKIYKATQDGFEMENILQKCQDKRKVIFLIKTNQNRRFGFYTDLEIKIYNNYVAQNPNNIFLFSLDLKQKYTSNESNCQYAFYFNSSGLAIGAGNDIYLHSNSNSNYDSYVNCYSYGKKEGLTGYALNGGVYNFTTSEIEIFEVKEV
ncbi:hypothetical protein ABPG72_002945 [Tetrahymena utriculariae]